MRALLVLLHRWFGLAVAVFLFIAGVTGALISWDHELDAWLNPQLFHARSAGSPCPGWNWRGAWKRPSPSCA